MKSIKYLKSAIALLCAVAVMLAVPVTAQGFSAPLEGEEFVKVAESLNLELYVKPSTTEFKVKNLEDGSEWRSCIEDPRSDPYVGGVYITEMQSLISAVYYDADGVMNTLNSYASSVLNNSFTLERIENGYRVTYDFEDGILKLPMEITLEEGALSVDVLASKLKVGEGFSVESISVLPFFAAAADKESGYLFVPDGCGGLISFDKDKKSIKEYSRRVYGANITEDETTLTELSDATPITLPVFGIKRQGSAMMCVIDKGDSMASINAYGAGNISSQNNVYASFSLYSNMEYTFSQDYVVIFENGDIKLSDISEKFYFLSGESADYNGMAAKLRGLMLEGGILTEKSTEIAPYITMYGGITVKRSFFGILTDTVIPLTTTAEVAEIAESAKKLGITSPIVNYVSWNAHELKGKSATSFKINGKIESGGVSFKELMKAEDFTFVPTVSDVFTYTKSANIISKFTSPATDISGTALFKKKLSESTLQEYGNRHFFLNKKYITKNLEKLFKSAAKSESEYIGLSDVSGMLYEDFSKSSMKRWQMQDIVTKKLNALSEDKKLMLDNPNYYALSFADELINIPMKTSGHLLIDKEIPFLQLVLSGCVRYSSEALNYEDSDKALLKLLETGSMPHFYMYYAAESTVKNTEYSHLGSGGYEKNLKKLSGLYSELMKVYEDIGTTGITGHKCMAEDVYAVSYGDTVIYINYSDKGYVTPGGNSIAPKGYVTEVAQ